MRSSPRTRWPGRFFLDLGRALYIGPGFDTSVHAHHAIQVCVGLHGTFRLRCHVRSPWRRYAGVVIGADQPHELAAGGQPLVLLYLEPEGEDGRALRPVRSGAPAMQLPPPLVARLRAALQGRVASDLDATAATRLFAEVTEQLGLTAGVRIPIDPRVATSLRIVRSGARTYGTSIDLARAVELSASRFRHLFSAEIGLSYRRYVLWLRLSAVIEELLRGASLTTAAHAAGFADSAHLSRTFRRMFGIVPSAMPQVTPLLQVRR
jgi:AraC family transcriptional regulator